MTFLSTGIQSSFGNFLKPMSQEFGWDRATVSVPIALAVLMTGVFQPFIGRVVDRLGPRRVITASVTLLALSTAAIYLTPSITYLTIVYGIVFALALSGAGTVPNATLVAHWFVRQRGRAMSLVSVGSSLGNFLLVPGSMALMLYTDWRTAYLVLGAVVLCLGVPVAGFILRNDPADLGLQPDGVASSPGDEQGSARAAAPAAPLEPPRWQGALTSTPFWLLIGGFFVCGFSVVMVSTHFVSFVTDRGISPGVAATALGLLGGVNVLGLLLAGSISDRIGRKTPLAVIYLVRAVAFAFLLIADAPWMFYAFALVAGLAWFSSVPLTIALTGEIYGVRHMGTLVGLVFLSHQVGGALSSYMAGWLFDRYGNYDVMFVIGIVLLLAAGAASYAVQERRYSLKYQAAEATVG
jgi:MFS family permease